MGRTDLIDTAPTEALSSIQGRSIRYLEGERRAAVPATTQQGGR